MENETTFRIVTRAVAVIAFLFALVQLLSLPTDAVSLGHHVYLLRHGVAIDHPYEEFMIRYAALFCLMRIVSLTFALWVALMHVRAGIRVRTFYGMKLT
jgi:ABC-type amino acid transport system permease subunit